MSGGAAAIDSGAVTFNLSGFLGGWEDQGDNAVVRATFKDPNGNAIKVGEFCFDIGLREICFDLFSVAIGPVTPGDRGNVTSLLFRSTSGAVPAGTRTIEVAMEMTREDGNDNDGYVDNVSLVLTASSAGLSFPTVNSPGPPTAFGPDNRSPSFFFGGQRTVSTGKQNIDVSTAASLIDEGDVTYTLDGFLGGLGSQGDNAVLKATFRGAACSAGICGTAQIGPVTASNRNNVTGLLSRVTSGVVPRFTRSIEVELRLTHVIGLRNDAYADNLSLELTALRSPNLAGVPIGGFPKADSPGPADRGDRFFYGGETTPSFGVQSINTAEGADLIDAGKATFILSGHLGGFAGQEDNAVLRATFRGAACTGGICGAAQIGPVTASARGRATGLVFRSASGDVPRFTRTIDVVLRACESFKVFRC